MQQRAIIGELDTHGINTRALCIGWPEQPPIERSDETPLELDKRRIVRKTAIKNSPRVKQLAGIYDLPPKNASEHTWTVRITLDRPWNIGLIVGPSGCGKSTIASELFGDKLVTTWPWPADASLIDGFPESLSLGDIINLLSSVGFSSPPHWLKPFHVLSNGEQFRVNLARTMAEMPDTGAILAIVVLNAVLGVFQQRKAERALSALQKLSAPTAKVVRGGQLRNVAARELVPGGRIEVEAGDHVPADARLVDGFGLQSLEAALTGESTPIPKDSAAVLASDTPLGDRRNMLFQGSVIATGKAGAVVVATGMDTELGRIAQLLSRQNTEPTPLQQRLAALGRGLVLLCVALVGIMLFREPVTVLKVILPVYIRHGRSFPQIKLICCEP